MTAPAPPAGGRAVIVLIGVSGSGKTVVGSELSRRIGLPFMDADDLHSPEWVERMRRGEPLTAAARDAWLERVAAAAAEGAPLVMACSALRREHRSRLREGGDVRMFLLSVPEPVLRRRLRQRRAHFFPPELLRSQLDAFEAPASDEGILTVDATQPVPVVVDAILAALDALP
jgi:gluconokinase